jgi:histidinol-phosphatase (PHP family)
MPPPPLPADDHSHSEWSWDASQGSMLGSCARAAALGLPAIAFTEHVDATRWVAPEQLRAQIAARGVAVGADGAVSPPPLAVDGYLATVARCRERYPDLVILTGVEVGEPHWFAEQTRSLLAGGSFERVLASLHSVRLDGQPWMVDHLIGAHAPERVTQGDVLRRYLDEAAVMVADLPDEVQVLAHLDYPVRSWRGGFDPAPFEAEFRQVLAPLAASGRALEINTRVPLADRIVGWWQDVGGEAVSFGADAHRPEDVGHGLAVAAAMAAAHGFRRDRHPHGFWYRSAPRGGRRVS